MIYPKKVNYTLHICLLFFFCGIGFNASSQVYLVEPEFNAIRISTEFENISIFRDFKIKAEYIAGGRLHGAAHFGLSREHHSSIAYNSQLFGAELGYLVIKQNSIPISLDLVLLGEYSFSPTLTAPNSKEEFKANRSKFGVGVEVSHVIDLGNAKISPFSGISYRKSFINQLSEQANFNFRQDIFRFHVGIDISSKGKTRFTFRSKVIFENGWFGYSLGASVMF